MMGQDEIAQPSSDAAPARKPWRRPELIEIDVADATYGPSNANTNDPDFISNPS